MTIELDDDQVQLLQMALSEYIAHRDRPSVEAYVASRYSAEYHSEEWRNNKTKDVYKRILQAENLRNKLFEVPNDQETA